MSVGTHHPALHDGDTLIERRLAPSLLRLNGLGDDGVELVVGEERARADRLLVVRTDRGLDVDVDHDGWGVGESWGAGYV